MRRAFVLIAIVVLVGLNGYILPLAVSGFMVAAKGNAGFVGEGAIYGGVLLLISAALLDVVIVSGLLVFGLIRLISPNHVTPRQVRAIVSFGSLALGAPFLIGYLFAGRALWIVLSVVASLVGWVGLRAVFLASSRYART